MGGRETSKYYHVTIPKNNNSLKSWFWCNCSWICHNLCSQLGLWFLYRPEWIWPFPGLNINQNCIAYDTIA